MIQQYLLLCVKKQEPPAFFRYFSSFDELNAEKKAATLSQEWLFFVCFIVNYTFLTLFLAYFVALGLRMFACAAARRAIGTLYGEQET